MEVERYESTSDPVTPEKVATPIPTEAEVVRALEEWEEGAAYRKVRHAANVGGCYSTSTICLAHETLENQRLTDDLVANRLGQAEFSASELNPTELGAPSVCEHVSVPVLNRILKGMRGTFTPEQAWHFMDYHVEECDYETLRLVADHTGFTKAERREFVDLHDWMANPEFAPSEGGPEAHTTRQSGQTVHSEKRNGIVKVLLIFVIVAVGIIAFITLGAFAFASVAVVVTALVAIGASGGSPSEKNKFPDVKSDHNRRVWAAEHNYEADGDDSHNYEADGDHPW